MPSKEVLMAALDVSQTTLREALQTLTAKGMINARTRVGTTVLNQRYWNMFDAELLAWRLEVGIGPDVLGMLFDIRQSLEPLAAALAAVRRTDKDVEALRGLTARMQRELRHSSAFVEIDVAFHRRLLEMSGNDFMTSISALIGTSLAASFAFSAPDSDSALGNRVCRQHEVVVDAIEDRDPRRAAEAINVVIRQGWTNIDGKLPRSLTSLDLVRYSANSE